jgi:hypothetical protein
MANQSVVVGGKTIPLVVPKSDLDVVSRLMGGKYYVDREIPIVSKEYRHTSVTTANYGATSLRGDGSILSMRNTSGNLSGSATATFAAEVIDQPQLAVKWNQYWNSNTNSFTLSLGGVQLLRVSRTSSGFKINGATVPLPETVGSQSYPCLLFIYNEENKNAKIYFKAEGNNAETTSGMAQIADYALDVQPLLSRNILTVVFSSTNSTNNPGANSVTNLRFGSDAKACFVTDIG